MNMKEMAAQEARIAKWKEEGRDEYDIKKQYEVLEECAMMVPRDAKALADAHLSSMLEAEADLAEEKIYKEAQQMLPNSAGTDEIAALAIRCNVFHTMRSLLKFSDLLREKHNEGTLQIQGAVYDITTGAVEFLGSLPQAAK